MNAPVQNAICRQCTDPFRFIRHGKRPRIYCEVCRELRYHAQRARFYERQNEAEKRLAVRLNAIACHEVAA